MGLRMTREGRLIDVVIDRPPVNALNGELYDALAAAFSGAKAGDVLLVRSATRHFCTGQDLAEHQADKDPAQAAADLRRGAAAIIAALRCEAIVVAAVHGAAIGAGALMACSADVLLVSDDAWLSLPELQVGVSIGGAVAARTLGGPLTRRMLLTGERIVASQLCSMGSARLVPRDVLEDEARRVTEMILGLDPEVLSLARSSWGGGEREAAAAAYEGEIEAFLARS